MHHVMQGMEEEEFEHEATTAIQSGTACVVVSKGSSHDVDAASEDTPFLAGKSVPRDPAADGQVFADRKRRVASGHLLKMSPPFSFYTFFGFYVATEIGGYILFHCIFHSA